MTWYDQTDTELSKTQESLQQMVDNYVEVHGKLTHERETMKRILAKRGIEPPPRRPSTFERPDLSKYGPDYEFEASSIMDEAGNAAVAAACAALTVIADPD